MWPWEADYVDLVVPPARLRITDSDGPELYEGDDPLPRSPAEGCPTCDGARRYVWQDVEEECDCAGQLALAKHYRRARIPGSYQRLAWEDFAGDRSALGTATSYVEKHRMWVSEGVGMTLVGGLGVGKTMLAALALRELVRLGYRGRFVTMSEMVEEFTKGWGSNEEKARFERDLVGSDVLVLDDIGKEFHTKNNLSESTFDHVLRRRVSNLRPTIITTNMTHQVGYGGAIFSLLKERSIAYAVEGNDWRENVMGRIQAERERGWTRPLR